MYVWACANPTKRSFPMDPATNESAWAEPGVRPSNKALWNSMLIRYPLRQVVSRSVRGRRGGEAAAPVGKSRGRQDRQTSILTWMAVSHSHRGGCLLPPAYDFFGLVCCRLVAHSRFWEGDRSVVGVGWGATMEATSACLLVCRCCKIQETGDAGGCSFLRGQPVSGLIHFKSKVFR